MQAGRSDLADGPQARHAGATARIGGDAAHVVVRRRRDRDQLARRIDAGLLAQREHGGEGRRRSASPMAARQSRKAPRPAATSVNTARATTSRGASSARGSSCRHEAFAGRIDQRRAFAAQRFRRQRRRIEADVDGGGMELHELGVGDHGAGARRHGDGLAARVRRVGRDRVEAADAARRQNYGAGGEVLVDLLAGGAGAHEAHAFDAAVGDDQLVGLVAFEHADRRRRAHLGDQRVENGGAGAVAGNVHDAAARVRRLLAQREGAVGRRGRKARRRRRGRRCAPGLRRQRSSRRRRRRCRRRRRSCRPRAKLHRRCCRRRPRRRPAPSRSRSPGRAAPLPAR